MMRSGKGAGLQRAIVMGLGLVVTLLLSQQQAAGVACGGDTVQWSDGEYDVAMAPTTRSVSLMAPVQTPDVGSCSCGDPVNWSDGTYDITMTPVVVTSDGNGTHITTPGVQAFGVNHDGVGDLLIENTGDSVFDARCTASLLTLGGRRWAVTAAHCMTNATKLQLTFATTSGNKVSIVSNPSQIHVHPNWNGNAINGFDVAVVQLDAVADPAVASYLLNRTANELDVDVVHVGYGNRGWGGTGQNSGTSGTKRAGLKQCDSQGLGSLGVGGITNNSTMLTDDFDSGSVANDGFNYFFGFLQDLGYGNDEVGVSQGDSGGSSFIQDPSDSIWKIAGIHSHGLRLQFTGGGTSDVDSTLNFSWGEFGVDARVCDTQIVNWIDQTIPEPATLLLLAMGGLALMRRKRK